MWQYIKKNQLHDAQNTTVKCDSHLRALFGVDSFSTVGGLSKLLKPHFTSITDPEEKKCAQAEQARYQAAETRSKKVSKADSSESGIFAQKLSECRPLQNTSEIPSALFRLVRIMSQDDYLCLLTRINALLCDEAILEAYESSLCSLMDTMNSLFSLVIARCFVYFHAASNCAKCVACCAFRCCA